MPQSVMSHRQRPGNTAGVLLLLLAAAIGAALAINHLSRPTNTSLQEHVLSIASQLRAPGDHNSMTVATSSLTTAQHMRYQIQQDVLAGMSDRQILSAMERTYGSQVLAAPAFGGIGEMFWIIPWLVLAILATVGVLLLRHGMRPRPEQPSEDADIRETDSAAVDVRLQDYF